MPNRALNDFTVTPAYTNMVATLAAAASVPARIQNITETPVSVVPKASGGAPEDQTGIVIKQGEFCEVSAAQIWIKAFGPAGKVSVVVTEA